MRLTPICLDLRRSTPNWLHFGHFMDIGRYRRPPGRSQALTYIFLNRRTKIRCPFIVNPARSHHLHTIANCRLCAYATPIGQTFFHNRIYMDRYKQIQTLRCI